MDTLLFQFNLLIPDSSFGVCQFLPGTFDFCERTRLEGIETLSAFVIYLRKRGGGLSPRQIGAGRLIRGSHVVHVVAVHSRKNLTFTNKVAQADVHLFDAAAGQDPDAPVTRIGKRNLAGRFEHFRLANHCGSLNLDAHFGLLGRRQADFRAGHP